MLLWIWFTYTFCDGEGFLVLIGYLYWTSKFTVKTVDQLIVCLNDISKNKPEIK